MRRLALAGIVLAAVALTSACSDDPNSVAAQANAGDGKGYVAGDGTVEQIAPTDRSTKIRVQGKTLEGKAIDSSTYLGKVVVLNKWGSWCPPCNAEAPGLEKTSQELAGEDVQFLGVDIRESAATGLAFQRRMKISYPSLAWDGGGVLLQMKGKANATPTTLVLDREGRLAGRISGEVTGSVLRDMVQDVLDEQPA
ncbi:TlpA family protein disulfide reductase [Angustibacter luteus]|uniref:TlpA family protein disulfide reductase n=1 Tax=Angustibacter luteus TaxID=658456 RepID=A0ABW1JEH5_9ACTN